MIKGKFSYRNRLRVSHDRRKVRNLSFLAFSLLRNKFVITTDENNLDGVNFLVFYRPVWPTS